MLLLHSVKIVCNLFIVILENCFGIKEKDSNIYALEADHLIEKVIQEEETKDETSYLDIMDDEANQPKGDSSQPGRVSLLSKDVVEKPDLQDALEATPFRKRTPSISEANLNSRKSLVGLREKPPTPKRPTLNETRDLSGSFICKEFVKMAINEEADENSDDGSHQSLFSFVVDDKIETFAKNEVVMDFFTILLYYKDEKVLQIKRSLEEIRQFDKQLKKEIIYDLPTLSTLSKFMCKSRSFGG